MKLSDSPIQDIILTLAIHLIGLLPVAEDSRKENLRRQVGGFNFPLVVCLYHRTERSFEVDKITVFIGF